MGWRGAQRREPASLRLPVQLVAVTTPPHVVTPLPLARVIVSLLALSTWTASWHAARAWDVGDQAVMAAFLLMAVAGWALYFVGERGVDLTRPGPTVADPPTSALLSAPLFRCDACGEERYLRHWHVDGTTITLCVEDCGCGECDWSAANDEAAEFAALLVGMRESAGWAIGRALA